MCRPKKSVNLWHSHINEAENKVLHSLSCDFKSHFSVCVLYASHSGQRSVCFLTSREVPITIRRSALGMSAAKPKNLAGRFSPKKTMSGLITPFKQKKYCVSVKIKYQLREIGLFFMQKLTLHRVLVHLGTSPFNIVSYHKKNGAWKTVCTE